ncbi:hypothetical protein [Sphingobacterium sp. E70]
MDNTIFGWNINSQKLNARYSVYFENSKILKNIDQLSGQSFLIF